MLRFVSTVAPMLALCAFAFGRPAFGQSLFEGLPAAEAEHSAHEDSPLTSDQKAAGDRESIF